MRKHNSTSRDGIPIYIEHDGPKIIGRVREGTFYKELRGSRHFLAEPRAIGFAASSIDDAERAGAVAIQVTDSDSGLVYQTTLSFFKANCFDVRRPGYEWQKAMRLEHFTVSGGRRRRSAKARATTPAPELHAPEPTPDATQLNLFG